MQSQACLNYAEVQSNLRKCKAFANFGRKPIPPNNDRFHFARVPAERKENSRKVSAEPSLLELCRTAAEFAEMQSICELLELYEVKVNPEIWMIPKKKSH